MVRKILIQFMVNIISYLIVSFIKWNIFWVKELPNYTNENRIFVIFGLAIIIVFTQLALSTADLNKSSNKQKK